MNYVLTITMKSNGRNKSIQQDAKFTYDTEEELREAYNLFENAMEIGNRNVNYSYITTEAKIVID